MAKRGNCYITCEALFHLLGGKKAGLKPCIVKHEGCTHWYLERKLYAGSLVIDPTVSQFKTKPNYHAGRGCGFLTKRPSKRARELMKIMLWQKVKNG